MNMKLKKPVKIILIALLAIIGIALIYVAYCFIDFYRLEDNIVLEVENPVNGVVQKNKEYKIMSFNIGFGAYEPDFGFFMDGGTQSWAWSRERLNNNLDNLSIFTRVQGADICLIQEVDVDSTRSYHIDERNYLIRSMMPSYCYTYAQNYDSPFLFYPFTQPHGKSVAGIMTFSRFGITDSVRRSLPIENGVMKLVDLDRCYSVNRIKAAGGRELVIFNLHLSAYTSDGKIAEEQLEMIVDQMQQEYEKGNWCIAGGDFNKDVLGGGSAIFGVSNTQYTWAQPIPESIFEGTNVVLIGPFNAKNPVPSCRNADGPYNPDQYQVTVDGFMVTDNVKVVNSKVIDTGFKYSDHNPVEMTFILK